MTWVRRTLLGMALGILFLCAGIPLFHLDRLVPRTLFQAVSYDRDPAAVRTLIEKGANVNQIANGVSPLHWAAAIGEKEILQILLENGADPNVRAQKTKRGTLDEAEEGRTPLHFAALQGHAEIVEMLVGRGAEVGARDRWGSTALDLAKRKLPNASELELANYERTVRLLENLESGRTGSESPRDGSE